MSKRIVALDMDGTLIRNTDSLLLLCDIWGVDRNAAFAGIEARMLAGEITWIEADYEIARLIKGLALSTLAEEFDRRVRIVDGLAEFMEFLRQRGIVTVLLSAGTDCVVQIMAQRFGFDYAFSSAFEVVDGKLTGEILSHIGKVGKVDCLESVCGPLEVPVESCVMVGDGVSDIPIFHALPRTIALNATDELKQYAKHMLDSDDIRALIPLLEKELCLSTAGV